MPNIRVFEWYGVGDVRLLPGVPTELALLPASLPTTWRARSPAATAVPHLGRSTRSRGRRHLLQRRVLRGGIDLGFLGFGGRLLLELPGRDPLVDVHHRHAEGLRPGGFGECGVEVNTQVSDTTVSIGTGSVNVSDTATIEGTGSVSAPDPTGSVDFYLCGPTRRHLEL